MSTGMVIEQVTLDDIGDHRGVFVVVDVLRAFTTAAFALDRGATAVRCVATVTFVITGVDARDGDEDRACADYLTALLRDRRPDPAPYLARVRSADAAAPFLPDDDPDFPASDLDHAATLDAVGFALRARMEAGHPTLHRG